MGGATENRAGAVLHQHEVCNKDRQLASFDEGVMHPETGVAALFLRRLDGLLTGAHAVAFGDELCCLGILLSDLRGQRMVG